MKRCAVTWAVAMMLTWVSGAMGYNLITSATFEGTANLNFGPNPTGTLTGSAAISGGQLVLSSDPASKGNVTYGTASQYYNFQSSSWGENTVAAVVNLSPSVYTRKALISDYNNAGGNWDSKSGVMIFVDGVDGAYAGPAVQLQSNGNTLTCQSPAPNYSGMTPGVDWFIAVSWKDDGDTVTVSTFMKRLDGQGSVYYSKEDKAYTFNPNYADGPETFVIGSRDPSGTTDSHVAGTIAAVQILGDFMTSQADFETLMSGFPVAAPVVKTVYRDNVTLEALYDNGTADLTVGIPATCTLYQNATVSGGKLHLPASASDRGGVITDGVVTNYFNMQMATTWGTLHTEGTWGENTVAGVYKFGSSQQNYRKALLGTTGGFSMEFEMNMILWADSNGSYGSPVLQLYANSSPISGQLDPTAAWGTFWVYPYPPGAGTWFVATSWRDNSPADNDTVTMRMYLRNLDDPFDGGRYFAQTVAQPNNPIDLDYKNLTIGMRDPANSGTYDEQLTGDIDWVRVYNVFLDGKADFDALFQNPAGAASVVAGDVDKDGDVDTTDLSLVLANMDAAVSPSLADQDGDGVFTSTDLSIVLAHLP